MLMVLGLFVFERRTLPYQSMQYTKDYRWASNNRIGKSPAYQFLGEGETTRILSGTLYPEITGGKLSLLAIELMANEGRAWPLIDGSGMIHGMYVVEKVTHTHTDLYSDGAARKIEFNLTLKRVDESLVVMYGDLKAQAETLVSSVGSWAGGLVG
ncbi:phage tail protein [Lelliottia nimipressuralis]|uniref:Phage tail protein n=1 Tax=Lelliottia nimipressuralis TaxID=69220 RepID=A0ABY3P8Q6_9ENTR|nr:phage tail protein [Lelliottia nimipressuralis]RXJ11471.1 phage tail protein [Lelliottia nimipressuralis]TYT35725.1 phage tail protein [Lelliottia nimipressuralis]